MNKVIYPIFIVFFASVTTVFSQETTGVLNGTTRDSLGNDLPFVKVLVTNDETE